jgi:nuclear pore complex protein Nup98-Nup96
LYLGGFGANTGTTAFGSKPFGSTTTGGGLFGGSSTGNAFGGGGFGANNNTTSTPAFGAANNNAGGSLFGGAKTGGFGASTGGGLFGGGNTGGGFGANNTAAPTTGAFGATTGGGFGAGATNNQPNNGTANVPFSAFSEKDGASSNATQQYQTITFQQPYQNYSLEELRVADYNQGRRYGNQNGQAGAFGQSTGFGGFGANNNTTTTSAFGGGANTNTGGGLFGGGANTNTTSAFGQSTGGAFGSTNNTTGGGLFGQNKPATGGLFGASTTTPAAGTTGGLFGGGATNTGTTGGFGSGGGGFGSSTTGGGGLFGNNQAQPKPAGGLFGSSTTTSTPFGGGAANTGNAFGGGNTGGGLFGGAAQNNTTTPAFGAAAPAANNTGGGLFGGGGGFGQNNQAQTQAQPASGGLFGGGGGFGQNNQQNQQKPGGLFGGGAAAPATGGGLFGGQQNNTTQQSGGLFGGSTANNNTGGGLFGQKPAATTGGGLFGGSTANTGSSGGGLFGGLGTQNNQQQNTGGGLFGGLNNQQKPGGLFGGSTQQPNNGGGLFGGGMSQNNQQQNLGGSLFSSQNGQQQNQQQNNNSLFGASGSSLLNTSMATNPYGNDALFAGLATPTHSPGPLATPLSSSQKNKKSAILPQHKLNPAASTRLLTPQNKRGAGYGFTYSTYGTPSSASQQGTNFGGSLFASGSLSRSLGKSLSTSNLRNSFGPGESILSPGAFSTSVRGYGNGSLKKLNVNKNLNTRIPLFDEPPQKRVSFASGEDHSMNGSSNGETALVVRRDDEDASPKANGNVDDRRPEMSQVNGGSQLARVHEDAVLTPKSSSSTNIQPGQEVQGGSYWSSPSLDELKRMSKQQLKSVPNFIVGRHNIGQITFNMGKPVDLSEVDLNKLYGDIVSLKTRNATVYGADCTALPKPALGSALNHPSEITLGQSWPRNRAGKKDVKHLERLKRVEGTTFITYNQGTGEWTFTVPHFSTYKLDYDGPEYDDDEDDYSDEGSSELSPVPDTPAQSQLRSSQMTSTPQDDSFASPDQSSPDDTFDFKTKQSMRGPRASVPGGFGDEVAYEEDEQMDGATSESFLGQRSVGSLDGQHDDYSEGESEPAQNQTMAESPSSPVQTTEQAPAKDLDLFKGTLKPKSILKASQVLRPGQGTPTKATHQVFDDDWANQLQRTISPKKQDRHALRESQGNVLKEQSYAVSKLSQSTNGRALTTAMDLMESLFGETDQPKISKRGGHGIEV